VGLGEEKKNHSALFKNFSFSIYFLLLFCFMEIEKENIATTKMRAKKV
jgi:hypothetical protein